VFLLGAAPGVAETAAKSITAKYRSINVCGTYSPPFGFERDLGECERIVDKINEVRPDLVVVGFGAPKQEIWLHQYAKRLHAKVAIAAGGTIDFLAGQQPRAPIWMRRIGMEWFHRLISDPRRLAGRYLYDACVFPQLVVKEYVRKITSKTSRL
jgi:N-acetylglucosaminyldiphosphoundecaprenol N-acetyl-beta-D-mannosaminyltransferase